MMKRMKNLLLVTMSLCLCIHMSILPLYAADTSEEMDPSEINISSVDDMSYDSTLYASSVSPAHVKAANGSKNVTISWDSVSSSAQYRVFYYSKSLTGSWQILCDTYKPSVISHLLSSSEPVYYSVRTLTNEKTDEPTASSLNKTAVKSIYTPYTTFQSVIPGANGVIMRWAKDPTVSYYTIFRKETDSSYSAIATIKNNFYDKGTTVGQYKDTTGESGKTYYYTIKAYTSYEDTDYVGGYDSVGTKGLYLSTPKLSSCTSRNKKVILRWSASQGASEYRIYRKTATGSFSCVGTATSTSYIDTSVQKGTTYYYTVRAYRESIRSGYDKTGTKILCK